MLLLFSISTFFEPQHIPALVGQHCRQHALANLAVLAFGRHDAIRRLFRIHGVGPQFAELLEAAGVDTVKEFRHRVAANLQKKMEEVNAEKNLVNRVPSESELQKMIDQAKEMEPVVTY
mgnify:CR=1 FL=1